jgi:hypothetical protein
MQDAEKGRSFRGTVQPSVTCEKGILTTLLL